MSTHAAHAPGTNYLNATHGWRSWFFTLDHKRIGVMYLASILATFLLGGILALLVRTELLTPGRTIVDADTYNRFFTLQSHPSLFESFLCRCICVRFAINQDVSPGFPNYGLISDKLGFHPFKTNRLQFLC